MNNYTSKEISLAKAKNISLFLATSGAILLIYSNKRKSYDLVLNQYDKNIDTIGKVLLPVGILSYLYFHFRK
jgi:hypothetical protein